MGLFSKPEVILLKESNSAKCNLEKFETLLPKSQGDLSKDIQKEIALLKMGINGEDRILYELKNSNMDMVVLHDVYIETKDGQGAQIDFIVITSKLIFLIECKNLYGDIEIDSKGNFIRTMEYAGKKHREGIYSPITQNERHMEILKERRAEDQNIIIGAGIRKTFNSFYQSLIVLSNPKTIVNDRYAKKEIKNQVIRVDQLVATLKQRTSESKNLPSSKKKMRMIGERLLAKCIDNPTDYFAKYEQLEQLGANNVNPENTSEETEKKICPWCGKELVLRTAQKGNNIGQKFYGCSSFPKCKYVLNLKKGQA